MTRRGFLKGLAAVAIVAQVQGWLPTSVPKKRQTLFVVGLSNDPSFRAIGEREAVAEPDSPIRYVEVLADSPWEAMEATGADYCSVKNPESGHFESWRFMGSDRRQLSEMRKWA